MGVLGAEGILGSVEPCDFRELHGEADLTFAALGWRARRIDSPYIYRSLQAGWGGRHTWLKRRRAHPNGRCCVHASVRVRISMGDMGVRVWTGWGKSAWAFGRSARGPSMSSDTESP